jgi:hypothetical protein
VEDYLGIGELPGQVSGTAAMIYVDVGWYDVCNSVQINPEVPGALEELGSSGGGTWFNQNGNVPDQQVSYLAEGEAYIL